MPEGLTILIAARDEAGRIGTTVEELRRQFPEADVIVADDGSRDATAEVAELAGALVLRLPHRGKGQALTLGERVANQGDLLLCDADLRGDLRPLLEGDGDMTVAAFARKQGGGFGIAKGIARRLIRLTSDYEAHEPLSGQRRLTQKARDSVFPLAAGFGCETAMTADAVQCRADGRRERRSSSSIAPPVATSAAFSTAAASCATSCSRSARRAAITAACASLSSAGSSPYRSRACSWSRRSASPTISGAGRSVASAPTCEPARRPAS